MRMVQTVMAASVLLFCSIAWATVYEWVDNKGVVHMTDNPDKVPARYRKVLKVREVDVGGITIPAEDQKAAVPAPDAGLPEAREVPLHDGHDKEWWQDSFKEARGSLKRLEEKIEDDKKELERLRRTRVLYQRPSDRVAYYALVDEIAKEEEQVKILQKNLDDLESRADGAGVPREWR